MKTKWRKLWIKALLSGEYDQTFGSLHTKEGYCCLGVLCDVVEPKVKWKWRHLPHCFYFQDEDCYPPKDLLKKVGLSKKSMGVLANMNDDGKSFKEIAAHIVKYR